MKLKKVYRKIPDTVRYSVTAVLLWGLAVLMGYAPESWRVFSGVVSGICLAGGLILVFFIVQRFLSERFNQVTMLQRMHAHVLYGRLTVIDAQLSSFIEKLDALLYPQEIAGFPFLEGNMPPLDDVVWKNSLIKLVRASRLHRAEQDNLWKALDALQQLELSCDEFRGMQGLEPSALMIWRDRLRQLALMSVEPLRKVIWHIEA